MKNVLGKINSGAEHIDFSKGPKIAIPLIREIYKKYLSYCFLYGEYMINPISLLIRENQYYKDIVSNNKNNSNDKNIIINNDAIKALTNEWKQCMI